MFRIQFPSCQIWKHLLFITTCKWSLQTTTKNHWLITIANLHTVHNFLWADLQHYIAYATSILSQLFLSYILCIVYHVVYYHIVYYHIHFLWDPFNREYTCILIIYIHTTYITHMHACMLWPFLLGFLLSHSRNIPLTTSRDAWKYKIGKLRDTNKAHTAT